MPSEETPPEEPVRATPEHEGAAPYGGRDVETGLPLVHLPGAITTEDVRALEDEG